MSDLPSNWEQCESEYNRHYDPYEEGLCMQCDQTLEVIEGELGYLYCKNCGLEVG